MRAALPAARMYVLNPDPAGGRVAADTVPDVPILALSAITKQFGGRDAVRDVSLSFERGKVHCTEAFARLISGWAQEGRDVVFLIGGAEGLDPALKQSAHLMLSLSAMTLPHQLVRVLLAEQLYRAVSLLRNHPYHRA